jgi:hypothetical protein
MAAADGDVTGVRGGSLAVRGRGAGPDLRKVTVD